MKNFLQNKAVRFLLIGGSAYLVWILLYHNVIQVYTNWDYYLNLHIVNASKWLLDVLGYESFVDVESDHVVLVLSEGDFRPIWVGDQCNGFKLFSIFTIFILAFPGKWKSKLWFIPLGIVFVHIANIIRVCALALINNSHPEYLDFNHLYTFTIFVYAIIFVLWYWYAKKFSGNVKKD